MTYLDDPRRWSKLAEKLEKAKEFGIDTETFGQPDKTSPAHRTKIQCWSVGVLTPALSTWGYHQAVGAVLPRTALDNIDLRRVLADDSIVKWAHNSPHDHHSLLNEGVVISNLNDSLQWLRVAVPGMQNYSLKDAEQWALGYPPRPRFLDLVTHTETIKVAVSHKEKGCICGAKPCHKKGSTDWLDVDQWRPHTRVEWTRFTPTEKLIETRWDVSEFNPGHPRWDDWVSYSLMDAVRGIELVDWLRTNSKIKKGIAWPWHSPVTSK